MAAPLKITLKEEDIQLYINKEIRTSHLAYRYQCSKKSIIHNLKKLNRPEVNERIKSNTMHHIRETCTMARTDEILAMYDAGEKLKVIAELIGVSIPTIWRCVKCARPDAVRNLKLSKPKKDNKDIQKAINVIDFKIPKTPFVRYQKMFTQSMMQL